MIAFSVCHIVRIYPSNDRIEKEEERKEKRVFEIHYRRKRREEETSGRKGWNRELRERKGHEKDRMVRAAVSRGLFAGDSFDRVFADGENSKRFREKRVSFSRLSHDTLSAVRKIKRARRTRA